MHKLSISRSSEFVPSVADIDGHVEVWRDLRGTICAYGQIVGDDCWMHLPGLASFRLARHGAEQSVAFTNTADDDEVHDAYRRRVLPMALHLSGQEVLHASAVCSDAGVIAFCADSETGKSTIAYGLHHRGYSLWADDAVVLETSGVDIRAAYIPFEMRLRPSAARLFGKGRDGDESVATIKVDSPTKSAPLLAIFVLRRGQTEDGQKKVTVRRLYSSQALEAILRHAWCFTLQDIERKQRMMTNYLDVVARTSIYDVCFEPGLEYLPTILDTIEDRLRSLTNAGPAAHSIDNARAYQ